jgi:hypothetical protein
LQTGSFVLHLQSSFRDSIPRLNHASLVLLFLACTCGQALEVVPDNLPALHDKFHALKFGDIVRGIPGDRDQIRILALLELSGLTGAQVFVKYESVQVTNSFKDRGAFVKLSTSARTNAAAASSRCRLKLAAEFAARNLQHARELWPARQASDLLLTDRSALRPPSRVGMDLPGPPGVHEPTAAAPAASTPAARPPTIFR